MLSRRKFLKNAAGVGGGLLLTRVLPFPNAANAQPGASPLFTFGLIADVQYADYEPKGTRYYRASVEKFNEAIDFFNTRELAFIVHVGDIIDRDEESFEVMLPIIERSKVPHYHVLGNHDFPVPYLRVLAKLGLERGYYDFGHQGWRFIVLDANELSIYANPEGSKAYQEASRMLEALTARGAVNAQEWNGAISRQQLDWLAKTLETSAQAGEQAVIINHFPAYPENVHNFWNDREVIGLLEQHEHVVAYFNGHNHAGNYGVKRGIHYVTLHGVVETPNSSAYGVAEVYPDRLEIYGFEREPDRALEAGDAYAYGVGLETI